MEPILKRAAWSLNIAAHGRRPVPGPAESQGFPLTRREKRKAGTQLSNKFGIVEYKGDWAWHKYFWQTNWHYWKCGKICWRCDAARIPRPNAIWFGCSHIAGNNSSKEKDGIYGLKSKRKGWDTYMLEVEKLNLQPWKARPIIHWLW